MVGRLIEKGMLFYCLTGYIAQKLIHIIFGAAITSIYVCCSQLVMHSIILNYSVLYTAAGITIRMYILIARHLSVGSKRLIILE